MNFNYLYHRYLEFKYFSVGNKYKLVNHRLSVFNTLIHTEIENQWKDQPRFPSIHGRRTKVSSVPPDRFVKARAYTCACTSQTRSSHTPAWWKCWFSIHVLCMFNNLNLLECMFHVYIHDCVYIELLFGGNKKLTCFPLFTIPVHVYD